MKKFLYILFILTMNAHAQEPTKKLIPIIIKPGDCINMHSGYSCYSDEDFKILDAQQNDAVKCQVDLLKAKQPIVVKKSVECPSVQNPHTSGKNLGLKIGLAALFSFALGLGIGLSQ